MFSFFYKLLFSSTTHELQRNENTSCYHSGRFFSMPQYWMGVWLPRLIWSGHKQSKVAPKKEERSPEVENCHLCTCIHCLYVLFVVCLFVDFYAAKSRLAITL